MPQQIENQASTRGYWKEKENNIISKILLIGEQMVAL
jgi:hypothetical protein